MWAPTLDELFAEAAVGLIAVMGEGRGAPRRHEVSLEAPDVDGLFVDWLSEVLFLFEARRFVPREPHVRIDGTRLDATIDGVDAGAFDQTGPAVKAVTYHGLEIKKTPDGYEAIVYVDV